MFEVRTPDSACLKNLIEVIKEFLNEASFDCTDNGIKVQAMDKSHVCLISVTLKSDGFDKYRCDRNVSMGINVGSLVKIFKCARIDDIVTIRAHDHPDTVAFIFESENRQKVSDYVMKLMNLDEETLEIPESVYSCVVKMPSMEFARICRDLSQFGEGICITCKKDGVQFSASGDIGTASITLVQTAKVRKEEEAVIIQVQESVKHTFSCDYLIKFIKASSISPQVTLKMSSNTPLLLEYGIPNFGCLKYYLAPKIDED